MNIIYISPIGAANPRLFPMFKRTFTEHTWTDNPKEATYCFFEIHSGRIDYNWPIINSVLSNGIPIIVFDNREYGPMQKESWTPASLIRPDVYFVRNMDKTFTYPDNVYPFDWPYFMECNFLPTTKEELFSRPYDVCFTGTESPTRTKFINRLLEDGRLNIYHEFRDHSKRIHYDWWINEYRKAKMFISCDGGGFTDERPNQLFAIAPMLKNKSNHLPENPFRDEFSFIEVNEEPTSEDVSKILKIITEKDWLYNVYMNGINHVRGHLSETSRAEYVLSKL